MLITWSENINKHEVTQIRYELFFSRLSLKLIHEYRIFCPSLGLVSRVLAHKNSPWIQYWALKLYLAMFTFDSNPSFNNDLCSVLVLFRLSCCYLLTKFPFLSTRGDNGLLLPIVKHNYVADCGSIDLQQHRRKLFKLEIHFFLTFVPRSLVLDSVILHFLHSTGEWFSLTFAIRTHMGAIDREE